MKRTVRIFELPKSRILTFVWLSSLSMAACLTGCGGGGGGSNVPPSELPPALPTVPSSFFGFSIQNPCSISNTGVTGTCSNPEIHSFPGLPLTWAGSLAPGNLKWSDIVQCDPTGSVCPVAGSGCSKAGVGPDGKPCPTADLVANCHPDSVGPDEPANCAYVWSAFDFWTGTYNAHGVDWMYAAYYTPDYLSIRGSRCTGSGQADFGPDETCVGKADVCQNQPGLMWGCDPPSDIDAIPGSGLADGTDQNYMWFVTAMMAHMQPKFEVIKYWEDWNEPDTCDEWNHNDQPGVNCAGQNPGGGPSDGTTAQLVRLATDARTIIPTFLSGVKVISPPIANVINDAAYMQQLLTLGGSAFDDIGYHGYFSNGVGCPSQCPVPELAVDQWTAILNSVNIVGVPTKSVLNTEFSWGPTSNVIEPDMRIAYAARSYVLQESYYPRLARVNWLGEDYPVDLTPNPDNSGEPNGGNGEFWASGTTYLQDQCTQPDGTQGGYDCPAGLAMSQVQKWTVGTSFLSGCTCSASPNGGKCSATPPAGIWQCPIVGTNAYQGLIVWDSTVTTFPCANLACGTTTFTIPSTYKADWKDLTGTITPLMGATTIMIGAKPIIIENE
jgi:hypothetical protein